ncbi:SMI1/KNR4 family protein [Exiguobacterium sp. BRG2]|uniref:SMI1/KNR4 family protein n=1 Tax=Exiguobacterium sp. BRG2 TaxID=2962584 RepID=UPI002880E8A0|nr:SMI1/KNR4 family protein [Exiguobacterium sp. BRG2]MDT0173861.1 SMI1/KNR4 family protein [Exiguobacterium sp. BRG2]
MKEMNQIEAVLDVLSQKINHGSTFIQRRYDTGVAQFNLNDPVTEQAIQSFEKQFKLTLPSEYKTFLRLHDGAELFMIQGLGIELYPLEKVIEMTIQAKEYDLIHEDYDHFLMIGEMNEGYVLIQTEDAKTDDLHPICTGCFMSCRQMRLIRLDRTSAHSSNMRSFRKGICSGSSRTSRLQQMLIM